MAKFEEVLPALRAGRKVRRAAWTIEEWIVQSYSGTIYQDEDGVSCTLSAESINKDDWEIVPEPKRVVEFETEDVVLTESYKGDLFGVEHPLLEQFLGKRVRVRVTELREGDEPLRVEEVKE